MILLLPWLCQRAREKKTNRTGREIILEGWQGVMGVLWSFELRDDLAASWVELYENTKWEKLLSLLSDWPERDGNWNPSKVESVQAMTGELDYPPRCKLASAASGSSAPSPSTWQSSCQWL